MAVIGEFAVQMTAERINDNLLLVTRAMNEDDWSLKQYV